MTRFDGKRLKEIRLHPVDLGFQRPLYQQGRPLLAEGEVAERVLERFQRRSQPFGTEIKIEGNLGLIQV
jgi:poly-gamma-glutamate synthesis protein (capsule biosynthesis protein)